MKYQKLNEYDKKLFLTKAFIKAFKPKKLLSGSEWADKYRYVAIGTSPEPGRWQTSRVPYLKDVLDTATKRSVEYVVIMAASQIGKSEILMNILGYYIAQEPSPVLFVQPTQDNARAFVKERINPTINASPTLKTLIQEEDKSVNKSSGDTLKEKHFPGGYLAVVGSRSPADLASKPIRVVLADELDRYEATKEGDPFKLAVQRTANFGNRKIIVVSTPTEKEKGNAMPTIFKLYEDTDKREFFIPCPQCNKESVWRWEHVLWDKDEDNNVIEESIRIECPHCKAKLRGNGKPDPHLIEKGVWRPTAKSKKKGFHVTALVSPWIELKNLVEEFVKAVRSKTRDGLREFYNLRLGLPFESYKAEATLWEYLYQRCENYTPFDYPNEVIFLTAGVDVQRDRLECSIYGWADNFESYLIGHFVLDGNPLNEEVWQSLDKLLLKNSFCNKNEVNRPLLCVFIDSGDGYSTDAVYRYTFQRKPLNFFSIKGSSSQNKELISRPTRVGVNNKTILFSLCSHTAKKDINFILSNTVPGGHYVHFPEHMPHIDTEFFKQLTSEVLVLEKNKKTNQTQELWRKIRARNEALDCFVYAYCAMRYVLMNEPFDRIKRKLTHEKSN